MNGIRLLRNSVLSYPRIPLRIPLRPWTATALDLGRRSLALGLVGLMVPLGIGNLAWGQEAPPPPPMDQPGYGQAPPPSAGYGQDDDQGPPPQQWAALSPDQLNQLVAPIALYPDSLVAQILAGATYPTQVVDADRFVHSYGGYPPDQLAQMANTQPWDPSIKSLTAFPSVLDNMNQNMEWTTQLGNAYYNQPQDVMSAVQFDRQQAWASGNLRPTPQLAVNYNPEQIVIVPANPAVVYVPYYNPWAVWGWHPYYRWYAPPPPRGVVMGMGPGLAFGLGVAVGSWSRWGWGWGHWGCGWGAHPVIVHQNVTYISRSVTVINHGYYGRFDRHPEARAFNQREAAHARAVGFNRGYAAGARQGYNRGYDRGAQAGYNHGYNRGAVQGYRGTANNRPAINGNRGQQTFNRPAQNYNRPQNYGRPAENYNRPQPDFNRPQPNQNRPQPNYRPAPNVGRPDNVRQAPQGHPGGGRPENRGGGPPENHGGGHPDNHGGGHGHGR